MSESFTFLRTRDGFPTVLICLMACVGCDFTGLEKQFAKLARSGERVTEMPPYIVAEVDRVSRERLKEFKEISDDAIRSFGKESKLIVELVDERFLVSREYALKAAARRTLIRACSENLDHESMLRAFLDEYRPGQIPLLPNYIAMNEKVNLDFFEDGTIEIPPIKLGGYGLDRTVSTDDWLVALRSRSSATSTPIERTVTLTEKSSMSATIDLQRAISTDDRNTLTPGDYDLIIKNRYSLEEPVTVTASVRHGVRLPTRDIPIEQATTFPLPLMNSVDWGFSVFETANGPKAVVGGTAGMFGTIPRRVFSINKSANGNLWESAMVSVEAHLAYEENTRQIVIVATASVAEWEQNGTSPRSDYTGGQLTQEIRKKVELAANEEVVGIARESDTYFGETRHVIGNGVELKIDATNSTLVRHVHGPIIRHHDSIPGYATITVEFHPVKLSIRKKQN